MGKIHPTVKQLIVIRGLRSFGQGMMVVDLTLYLAALHWSGAIIGGVLTAAGIFGAILILGVGIYSDRYGRKPFLIIAESLATVSAIGATFTSNGVFLTLAIVVAGFGRGQTGSAGPFAPAEQAWLALLVPKEDRGRLFSLNTGIGFLGMGMGALVGGTPHFLQAYFSSTLAFRPIFALVALLSIVCLILILRLPSDRSVNEASKITDPLASGEELRSIKADLELEAQIRKSENRNLMKLAFVNVVNGLAIGLTGPLMAYWFSIKYGVGSGEVGLTLALSFLLTSVSSVVTGYIADRVGLIRSVIVFRMIGVVLMFLLPFSPTFLIASSIYIVRNALNRGTQGARSALNSSLTRDKRRGLASSVGAMSMRFPSSIGPTLSGMMLDANLLAVPFFISSGLQLGYLVLYQSFFKSFNYKKNPQDKNE